MYTVYQSLTLKKTIFLFHSRMKSIYCIIYLQLFTVNIVHIYSMSQWSRNIFASAPIPKSPEEMDGNQVSCCVTLNWNSRWLKNPAGCRIPAFRKRFILQRICSCFVQAYNTRPNHLTSRNSRNHKLCCFFSVCFCNMTQSRSFPKYYSWKLETYTLINRWEMNGDVISKGQYVTSHGTHTKQSFWSFWNNAQGQLIKAECPLWFLYNSIYKTTKKGQSQG